MRLVILILLFIPALGVRSQSISMDAISFCGDTYINTSAQLSFTVGEIAENSYTTGGIIINEGYQQTYYTYWIGDNNSSWTNPLNWSGGPVPDLNADIIVLPGRPNGPVINTLQSCRTLQLRAGTTLFVNSGSTLRIRH